jgi:L-rhamnonate dehydratase
VAVPLAAGEEETTVADFERLIEAGAVEIIQPDVTRAGGITELMRIAEVARRRGRRCIPHAWSTGIIKAATLHVLAAMPEAEYMEYCVQSTPLNESLVAQEFPVVDGFVRVPDGAGLGVDVDRERLAECLVDATG